MRYEILENGDLRIFCERGDKTGLRRIKREAENFISDDVTYDVLEWMTTNDSFFWHRPEDIGALTSAPILGINGPGYKVPHDEVVEVPHIITGGHHGVYKTISVIEIAWGFMEYMLTSPQQELLETGESVWDRGWERCLDAREYAKPHWQYTGDGPDPDDYETIDRWFGGHDCPEFKENDGRHFDKHCPHFKWKEEETRRQGVPNLDAMITQNLWGFYADTAHRAPLLRKARELFPRKPKGYVRATEQLGLYASNKATAQTLRESDNVVTAKDYERICKDIYNRLPEFARW